MGKMKNSNFQLDKESKPPPRKPVCLIYGSYGFMGSRVTQWAIAAGLPIVVTGRSEEKLKSLVRKTF